MARKQKPAEEIVTPTQADVIENLPALSIDEAGQKADEIKARIERGTKQLEQAQNNFLSAGVMLMECQEIVKANKYKGGFTKWLKDNGIGKSQAYECIAIAKGEKTVDEMREQNAQRQAKHQQKKKASGSNGQEDVDSDAHDKTEDIENWSDELAAAILKKIDDGAHEDRSKFRKWLMNELKTFGMDCAE